ncbi:extracellular solute-binding protein [Plantibacter sp. T3]|uniref:extracellular solute-binding protein n=1 Tax=Plantibacter sp. T3 TaxID=2653161 RepID=UPI0012F2886E|nr:extracellular solute-binding protein [Plantibacter sp. T3]VXB50400.1 Extracellular solute-binding protein [Plantibacter sp. T3]
MNDTTSGLSRRTFLTAAGVGLAVLGLGSALAGCTPGGATSGAAGSGALVPLPTYVPITKGPTPDLAGSATVQPVYLSAPKEAELFTSVSGKAAVSGTVSGFVISYSPPAPASNSYLQAAEQELGCKLDLQVVPADSFAPKFATVVAGGSVPDLVEFLAFQLPPSYPQLLKAQFADLSDHLSGDKVKAYPNLANLPTPSWEGCRINGRIYGVPVNRPPFGNMLISRPDVIKDLTGAEPAPKTKDEFTELCKAVTDAKRNRYAISGQSNGDSVDWGYDFMGAMFGVPNGWELQGSKLVHKWESDRWLETLSYIKELKDAGYYHPDTPSISGSQAKTYMANGTVLMHQDGISAIIDPSAPEGVVYDAILPFAADGGDGIVYQGSSMFSFTAIKQADDARVKELLTLLNHLAAPYGSTEGFFLQYGRAGEHHTREADGRVVLTEAGSAQIGPTSLNRLAAAPQILASAVPMEERLRRSHAWQEQASPMLQKSPITGLYSETAGKTSSATNALSSTMNEYVLGRTGFDAVKSGIASWKKSTNDKVRAEYQEQLEKLS